MFQFEDVIDNSKISFEFDHSTCDSNVVVLLGNSFQFIPLIIVSHCILSIIKRDKKII